MSRQLKRPLKKLEKVKSLYGPVATVFNNELTGSWRIFRPVFEEDECFNCLTCQLFCPTDAITINKEKKPCLEFNLDYCKGCGICMNVCPRNSIKLINESGDD